MESLCNLTKAQILRKIEDKNAEGQRIAMGEERPNFIAEDLVIWIRLHIQQLAFDGFEGFLLIVRRKNGKAVSQHAGCAIMMIKLITGDAHDIMLWITHGFS